MILACVQEVCEWVLTFRVSAFIMVGGALLYGTLASGELQPWSQLYNHNNNHYHDTHQQPLQQQPHAYPAAATSSLTPTSDVRERDHQEEDEDERHDKGEAMQTVRGDGLPRSHGGPSASLPLLLPARDHIRADYASLAIMQANR